MLDPEYRRGKSLADIVPQPMVMECGIHCHFSSYSRSVQTVWRIQIARGTIRRAAVCYAPAVPRPKARANPFIRTEHEACQRPGHQQSAR